MYVYYVGVSAENFHCPVLLRFTYEICVAVFRIWCKKKKLTSPREKHTTFHICNCVINLLSETRKQERAREREKDKSTIQ